MSEETTLGGLSRQLSTLASFVDPIIAQDAQFAFQYAREDPDGAAVKAGRALEALLGSLYDFKLRPASPSSARAPHGLEEIKKRLQDAGSLPRPIAAAVTYIQQLRNDGAHARSTRLQFEDLESILVNLVRVIRWYVEEIRGSLPQLATQPASPAQDTAGRIPVITRRWATVIPHRFTDAKSFYGGRARVADHHAMYGIIDIAGTMVVPCRFSSMNDAGHGLYRVRDTEGLWGLIDSDGRLLADCIYSYCGTASGGFTPVSDAAGGMGYISYAEHASIPCTFLMASEFCEGLARVQLGDGRFGFLNAAGSFQIEPIFANAGNLKSGMAAVEIENYGWGFLDASGTFRIQPRFEECRDFSEGFAGVRQQNLWGLITTDDQWLTEPRYADCGEMIEGWCRVFRSDGTWTFLSATGQEMPSSFSNVRDFHRGVARVQDQAGLWGLIDRQGSWIAAPGFQQISRSSEAVFRAVNSAGRHQFIGPSGDLCFPDAFDDASDFSEGAAAVCIGELWGYVSHRGECVLPFAFTQARDLTEGAAAAQRDGKWGFIRPLA